MWSHSWVSEAMARYSMNSKRRTYINGKTCVQERAYEPAQLTIPLLKVGDPVWGYFGGQHIKGSCRPLLSRMSVLIERISKVFLPWDPKYSRLQLVHTLRNVITCIYLCELYCWSLFMGQNQLSHTSLKKQSTCFGSTPMLLCLYN